ncbi:hypothetical protein S83_067574 [Arachis hypogaea]
MVVHGVAPNNVTYIGLLSACSHEGMVSVGVMLFEAIAVEMCGCWWTVNVVVCWGRESVGRGEVVMAMVRGKRRGIWFLFSVYCHIFKLGATFNAFMAPFPFLAREWSPSVILNLQQSKHGLHMAES